MILVSSGQVEDLYLIIVSIGSLRSANITVKCYKASYSLPTIKGFPFVF